MIKKQKRKYDGHDIGRDIFTENEKMPAPTPKRR